MKIIFYQANFCAECGNAMKPRFSLGPRYFCAECEAQLGRRNYLKTVAGLLLCGALAVFALNRTRLPNPNVRLSNDDSTVSARDTVTTRKLEPEPEAVERVQCGARTLKGTPCKRLVLPGQRCAQHRGRASLLETKAASSKSATPNLPRQAQPERPQVTPSR
jgi:hypothetical protein